MGAVAGTAAAVAVSSSPSSCSAVSTLLGLLELDDSNAVSRSASSSPLPPDLLYTDGYWEKQSCMVLKVS